MQHPLCNKKDFDQSLTELDMTVKDFLTQKDVDVSYEWLRKVLTKDSRSPKLEKKIIALVKKGEKKRALRLQKRQQQINSYSK